MTEKQATRVGVDVGFGYTKAAWVDDEGKMRTVTFPSILAGRSSASTSRWAWATSAAAVSRP